MGIRILGTGHILEKSVSDIEKAIEEATPGIVAVELDLRRFRALEGVGFRPEECRRDASLGELLSVLRRGGGSLPVFVQFLLAALQKELGTRYGIAPGSDMCAAILRAQATGARVALIDRDIEVTMSRLLNAPYGEFARLLSSGDRDLEITLKLVDGNIEEILEKDNISLILSKFRKKAPGIYGALVDERDACMAAALMRLQAANPEESILAVVGAAHKDGIGRYLTEGVSAGDLARFARVKKIGFLRFVLGLSAVALSFVALKIGFFFGQGKNNKTKKGVK